MTCVMTYSQKARIDKVIVLQRVNNSKPFFRKII